MNLSEFKSIFRKQLSDIYPAEETDSIFYLVIEYVLKYSKIDIHQKYEKEIPSHTEKKLKDILQRLENFEPVQYILGETEFYGLKLKTDPRALIPRTETEFLTDLIVKEHKPNASLSAIDLCTGTGCIAISLAINLTRPDITAIDISAGALELANKNASLNKVNIRLIEDDLFNINHSYNLFDIVVSNPPYVRSSEKKFMHKNVLMYEPGNALFVNDDDPLIFYRAIAEFARPHLKPGGYFYVEINEAFGKETIEIFNSLGFKKVTCIKDLQNKDRIVKGSR